MTIDNRPATGWLAAIRGDLASLPWGQLCLISAVAIITVAAMLNFAPLLPLVREDLGLSNTWAAMLTSAAVFSHTLLQLPGGQITDSLGIRRSVLLGTLLIGASLLASGMAPNVPLLLASRLVLGVGTSITFVAGLAFTNALVPAHQRVLAQSVFGASASLGILAVLLLSERVAALGGWRTPLVLEGVAIMVVGWLIAARLRDGVMRNGVLSPSWSETLRHGPLYLLGMAHVITYGVFIAVTTWVVTFLWQGHGVGLEWAGPLAAILTLSAIGGRIVGGAFSTGRERRMIVGSCAAAALCVGALPVLPGVVPALLALLAFGWFVSVPFGAVFSYASLLSGRVTSGRELSLINFVGNLGALAFPLVIGYALDAADSFVLGFGSLAVIGLAGSAALALWLPRPNRRPRE